MYQLEVFQNPMPVTRGAWWFEKSSSSVTALLFLYLEKCALSGAKPPLVEKKNNGLNISLYLPFVII
jgi:hypothetical protein